MTMVSSSDVSSSTSRMVPTGPDKQIFFRFCCRRPFSAWENEETRRVTDVERLAEEKLAFNWQDRHIRQSFIGSSSFFHAHFSPFLRKKLARFQRSRCKGTHFSWQNRQKWPFDG